MAHIWGGIWIALGTRDFALLLLQGVKSILIFGPVFKPGHRYCLQDLLISVSKAKNKHSNTLNYTTQRTVPSKTSCNAQTLYSIYTAHLTLNKVTFSFLIKCIFANKTTWKKLNLWWIKFQKMKKKKWKEIKSLITHHIFCQKH